MHIFTHSPDRIMGIMRKSRQTRDCMLSRLLIKKKQAGLKTTCVGLVDRSHEKTILNPLSGYNLFVTVKVQDACRPDRDRLTRA